MRDREKFKDLHVQPEANEINFIEYDQKIKLENMQLEPAVSLGIDNWAIP